MRKHLLLFVTLCLMGFSQPILAQIQVSGTVTDAADGTGLPGVSVLVKGTTTGTATDANGNYSLSADPNATLVFSAIGYTTQEIAVNNQSTINLSMGEDVASLSEIVVVGYGEQEKKDVTGALATIKAEDFNAGAINSPEQLFQGKLSGVLVVANTGEPGGGININIRGANSIRSDNNPLFVVDGFPLDGRDVSSASINIGGLGSGSARNPLNFINPDDIESIDVLKDASATAIYGSRGANGVILITTKKAKPGETSFNVNSFVGFSTVTNEYDLLDRESFLAGVATTGSTPLDYGSNTDWQNVLYRTAITHSHSISMARGTETGAYRASLSFFSQEGVIETSKLERITARLNGSQNLISDRVTADLQLTIGHVKDDYVPISNDAGFEGSLIGAALQANPTIPTRNFDGSIVQRGDLVNGIAVPNDFNNPLAFLELWNDEASTTRILGNVGFNVKIVKGLTFRSTLGLDYSFSERRVDIDPAYQGAQQQPNGAAAIQDQILSSVLTENFFTYKTEFGQSKLTVLAGYSFQEFRSRFNLVATNENVVPGTDNTFLGTNNLSFGQLDPNIQPNPTSGNQTNRLQSGFGRIQYSFADKYLVTATLRADGSSRFGDNNKYAYFPSVALAWRMSDEDFIPDLFTELKLRFGWGQTGNQELPNGSTVARFNVDPNSGEASQESVPNPDLKWEETTQWNIGVDFAFLDGRISGTIDYYDKTTTDLALFVPVPQPAPFPRAFVNVPGDLINRGIELSANALIFTGENDGFRWELNGNFTYFTENVIEGIGTLTFNTGAINGQGLSGQFSQRIEDGQPLGAFYMPVFEGFDENGDAILANDGERQFVGQAQPDFIYGITTQFAYKRFDLTMNFNGVAGNDVYNNTANALFSKPSLRSNRNVTEDVVNSAENPNGTPTVSTQYLQDAGYFRMNNLTLGYTFNTSGWDWINRLKLYFTGQNLFVITDYDGQDPEVNVDKNLDGVPSFGIEYTNFPRNRTFIFGVQLGF